MEERGVDPIGTVLACLEQLIAEDPTALCDGQRLERQRGLQQVRNVLAAAEHASIADIERRGLPQAAGAASTALFLRDVLRIDAGEARARVLAAQAAGPRWGLTGEQLTPRFEKLATAQAAGVLDAAQARVIVHAVDALPDAVLDQAGDVEAQLVGYAATFTARQLDTLATRIHACLDPDGRLRDEEYRQRRRSLELGARTDGSSSVTAECTAELTETMQAVFDSLAAPEAADDGTKDPRSAGQRRHDALLDALRMALRAGGMPDAGGIRATVLLLADQTDWNANTGTVRTGHGAIVPTETARQWAEGASRTMTVTRRRRAARHAARPFGDKAGRLATDLDLDLDTALDLGALGRDAALLALPDPGSARILGMSSVQRCFTERQRLAMVARDRGCSFPGCDVPPQWCEAHHVIRWQDGGATVVENGTLLCGHHHRTFEKAGWRVRMHEGVPQWIPPPWIDVVRQPRTNHAHV